MKNVTIRDYIDKEKEVTAAEVRRMEPGTKVRRHTFDRYGVHQWMDMTVWIGTGKFLRAVDYNGDSIIRIIKKESDRLCYTIAE